MHRPIRLIVLAALVPCLVICKVLPATAADSSADDNARILAGIEPRKSAGGRSGWSGSREHLAFPEYYQWAAQMPGAAGRAPRLEIKERPRLDKDFGPRHARGGSRRNDHARPSAPARRSRRRPCSTGIGPLPPLLLSLLLPFAYSVIPGCARSPRARNPYSQVVVMDSGLALRAPRNNS